MSVANKIQVLYVEDEPSLAKIVKETIESRGYVVTLVTRGGEAFEVFKSGSFDLCILDIMLPDKSGFEIAQEIRQDSNIPILFLTAKDQTADVVKGFSSGGNDYIRKPFSMEELLVRMQNLLQLSPINTSQNGKAEIHIGDKYIFYKSKHELHFEDQIKALSHRESQILEMLSKNLSEIVQRKDILMQVWNDDSFYNSRNLDVYITKLRGYLKNDSSIKILTLKGVGYQFVIS